MYSSSRASRAPLARVSYIILTNVLKESCIAYHFQYIVIFFLCSEERNAIEAAAKGASTAISLVANVTAMLITFFAFIAFFNAVLSYMGSMVGYPELSFQVK